MTVRSAFSRRLDGLRPILVTAAMVSVALAVFAAASSTDLSQLVATSPDPDRELPPTSNRATSSTVRPSDAEVAETSPAPTDPERSGPETSDRVTTTTDADPQRKVAAETTVPTSTPVSEPEPVDDDESPPTTGTDPTTASTTPTTASIGDDPSTTASTPTTAGSTGTESSGGSTGDLDQAVDPTTGDAEARPSGGGAESDGSTAGDAVFAGAPSDDSGLSLTTVIAWLIALIGLLGVLSLLVPAVRSLAERWDRRDRGVSWWRALLRLFTGRDRPDDEAEDDLAPTPAALDPIVVLDRLRQELEREPHPRQAVRRAYAAAESGFGNPDLARHSTETPSRYLVRTLGSIGQDGPGGEHLHRADNRTPTGRHAALTGLTELFLLARYSDHAVTEDMRGEAIEAVLELRSQYRRPVAVSP
ncbi:MAG: hypothetical protein OEV40_01880 [Acidimicrobiia bacterium]|nr:hypothetical protein [Acidimicrobiia bacterium]